MIRALKQAVKSLLGPRYVLKRQVAKQLVEGEAELHFLPVLCDRQGEFLDVGANVGYYAAYAARFSRRVIAMEPHPTVADQLARSVPRNVRVLRVAASDHSGKAELRIPTTAGADVATRSSIEVGCNPGFAERMVEVELLPVDSVDFSNLAVIKIDVEGHELAVLGGAAKTIQKFKPAVIVECEERHHAGSTSRLFNFFSDAGYDGFFYMLGKMNGIAAFDPLQLQRPDAAKPVSGRRRADYINNFIFLPRPSEEVLARLQRVAFGMRWS